MQAGTRSQVALEGPLGAGGVQITADGDSLSIDNSHGEHLDSDAAHAELEARLGFDPPLNSLRYWIQGVPDPRDAGPGKGRPAAAAAPEPEPGRLADRLHGYMPGAGGALPAKLTLQRAGVRVRLVVDGWS